MIDKAIYVINYINMNQCDYRLILVHRYLMCHLRYAWFMHVYVMLLDDITEQDESYCTYSAINPLCMVSKKVV